jgi:hypothetical protein
VNSYGYARDRIAGFLQKVEVTEGVAGLGLRRVAEQPAHIRIAFDVGPACEIEVAPVRLRLAGERRLQVLVRARTLERLRHRGASWHGARFVGVRRASTQE